MVNNVIRNFNKYTVSILKGFLDQLIYLFWVSCPERSSSLIWICVIPDFATTWVAVQVTRNLKHPWWNFFREYLTVFSSLIIFLKRLYVKYPTGSIPQNHIPVGREWRSTLLLYLAWVVDCEVTEVIGDNLWKVNDIVPD